MRNTLMRRLKDYYQGNNKDESLITIKCNKDLFMVDDIDKKFPVFIKGNTYKLLDKPRLTVIDEMGDYHVVDYVEGGKNFLNEYFH